MSNYDVNEIVGFFTITSVLNTFPSFLMFPHAIVSQIIGQAKIVQYHYSCKKALLRAHANLDSWTYKLVDNTSYYKTRVMKIVEHTK